MNQRQSATPFRPLGKRLKALRDQANETLAEASGAVEIDVRQLASFELGQIRPNEEVLLLLISHFGAQDDEAIRLWELAGYGMSKLPVVHMANNVAPQPSAISDTENRILFTDTVDVMVNNYGVVMNFMQHSGDKAKASVVARVGMSREHAKSVLQILQTTLAQTEIKTPKMPQKLSSSEANSPEEPSRG